MKELIVYRLQRMYGNLIKEYWDFNGKWNQTFIFEYEKVKNINK